MSILLARKRCLAKLRLLPSCVEEGCRKVRSFTTTARLSTCVKYGNTMERLIRLLTATVERLAAFGAYGGVVI